MFTGLSYLFLHCTALWSTGQMVVKPNNTELYYSLVSYISCRLLYLQTEVSLLMFSNRMLSVCSNCTQMYLPDFCLMNRRKNDNMFFSRKKLNQSIKKYIKCSLLNIKNHGIRYIQCAQNIIHMFNQGCNAQPIICSLLSHSMSRCFYLHEGIILELKYRFFSNFNNY